MKSNSSSSSGNSNNMTTSTKQVVAVSRSSNKAKKRPRPQVQVVQCGSAFPISTKPKMSASYTAKEPSIDDKNNAATAAAAAASELEFGDVVQDVRTLAASAYVGQQKRDHDDELYQRLTGRRRKRQQVPYRIAHGIQQKAAARQAQQRKEAREAGIVLPKTANVTSNRKNKERNNNKDKTARQHGPAPSIGFTNKGVYRVKQPPPSKNSRHSHSRF